MKVALVHDLLTQLGGAERVLDCLLEMYPEAPVYTVLYDRKATAGRYERYDIRPSFLQNFPKAWSYKWYLPLMPRAVKSFDLRGYDLVLSDVSAFAKGVRVPAGTPHICYCHTPTRYLWSENEDYIASLPYPNFVKWGTRRYLAWMKQWDYQAAQKVSCFIANSREVQRRIEKSYHRDAAVVYPPVDTDFFSPKGDATRDYFLAAGRLEPYKRTEIVLGAFRDFKQPLKVAGSGGQLQKLERLYRAPNIQFLGRVSDTRLRALYQNAKAFIFPALEDAGMMVVEALACGTPVIAYQAGGALEFLREGITGKFFTPQNSAALLSVLKNFRCEDYASDRLRATALNYDRATFMSALAKIISRELIKKL